MLLPEPSQHREQERTTYGSTVPLSKPQKRSVVLKLGARKKVRSEEEDQVSASAERTDSEHSLVLAPDGRSGAAGTVIGIPDNTELQVDEEDDGCDEHQLSLSLSSDNLLSLVGNCCVGDETMSGLLYYGQQFIKPAAVIVFKVTW